MSEARVEDIDDVEDYSSDSDGVREISPEKVLENSSNPYGIKVENLANRDGDILPFALFSPESEGKCTWNCGFDANGKITSVFCFKENGETQRVVKVFDTPGMTEKDAYREAVSMRDELLKNGWLKLTPPQINFSVPDGKGGTRNLNRKEKRRLLRKNLK
jgi:hypothetical protein